MPFPSSPTNGQKATLNGVTYTYNSGITSWTVTSTFRDSFTGNALIANTVTTSGAVSGGSLSAGTLVLSSTATISGNTSAASVLPIAGNTHDLGSTSLRWRNIYTQDLHLNNSIGDWTIVEGEDDLFLYNNKRGKVYKFALIEVDPSVATPKIDALNVKP